MKGNGVRHFLDLSEIPADELPYAVTPSLTAAVALAAVGTLAIGLWPEPVLRLVSGTAQLLP